MWPVGMSGDPGGRIIWVRAVWKSRGTRLRRGFLVSCSTSRTILAQDVLYYVPSPVLTTRFGHCLCSQYGPQPCCFQECRPATHGPNHRPVRGYGRKLLTTANPTMPGGKASTTTAVVILQPRRMGVTAAESRGNQSLTQAEEKVKQSKPSNRRKAEEEANRAKTTLLP